MSGWRRESFVKNKLYRPVCTKPHDYFSTLVKSAVFILSLNVWLHLISVNIL